MKNGRLVFTRWAFGSLLVNVLGLILLFSVPVSPVFAQATNPYSCTDSSTTTCGQGQAFAECSTSAQVAIVIANLDSTYHPSCYKGTTSYACQVAGTGPNPSLTPCTNFGATRGDLRVQPSFYFLSSKTCAAATPVPAGAVISFGNYCFQGCVFSGGIDIGSPSDDPPTGQACYASDYEGLDAYMQGNGTVYSTDPCSLDPTLPQCQPPPSCSVAPTNPDCVPVQQPCSVDPTGPGCPPITPPSVCQLNPSDPSCVVPPSGSTAPTPPGTPGQGGSAPGSGSGVGSDGSPGYTGTNSAGDPVPHLAGGGVSCSSPPSCSGEAILCASLYQQWKDRCATEGLTSVFTSPTVADGIATGTATGQALSQGKSDSGVLYEKKDISIDSLDTSGLIQGSATCPLIASPTVMGQTLDLSAFNTNMCSILTFSGFLMLIIGTLVSVKIIAL